MNILICDDQIHYLNDLKNHVEEYMKNRYIQYDITTTCNPLDVLSLDTTFDLAFLDIQMNELDGMSLAVELKKRNEKVVIFFITSFKDFQDDAMDLNAFRFFEKPFDVNRLYSGIDKAMEHIDKIYIDLFTYDNKDHVKIPVDNIFYIESHNRKTIIYTAKMKYQTREKIDELIERLPHSFFYHVHKSFLVNLHYVDRYCYTELFLTDGTRIPISSRKQADFHKYWFLFIGRR